MHEYRYTNYWHQAGTAHVGVEVACTHIHLLPAMDYLPGNATTTGHQGALIKKLQQLVLLSTV
jgi:hypothetical protein